MLGFLESFPEHALCSLILRLIVTPCRFLGLLHCSPSPDLQILVVSPNRFCFLFSVLVSLSCPALWKVLPGRKLGWMWSLSRVFPFSCGSQLCDFYCQWMKIVAHTTVKFSGCLQSDTHYSIMAQTGSLSSKLFEFNSNDENMLLPCLVAKPLQGADLINSRPAMLYIIYL